MSLTTTTAFEERERLLKDEIMPAVLGMRRFLGQLNYDEEFCGRQRKGQLSWEFEDKETKTTFKPTLIGEIATPTYGTLLKGRGNFKPPRTDPVSITSVVKQTYSPMSLDTDCAVMRWQ